MSKESQDAYKAATAAWYKHVPDSFKAHGHIGVVGFGEDGWTLEQAEVESAIHALLDVIGCVAGDHKEGAIQEYKDGARSRIFKRLCENFGNSDDGK